MKTKFSMRNPKYGMPLILLPFILLGAWVISSMFPPKDNRSAAESATLEGINSTLPDPSLSSQKDKFTLLQELLARRTSESGITNIDELRKQLEEELNINNDESGVSDSFLSVLTDSTFSSSDVENDAMSALEALHKRYFPDEPSIFADIDFNNDNRQPRNAQEEEMREMREQIAMLQMMMSNQSENESEIEEEIEPDILTASKADSRENNYFNTIKANKKDMFISAILDEAQTVVSGSRIRIRLMDDIFIGDYLFKRGSYLYGLVTGFSAQRVKVTVTTVLYGDKILKLKLSVYDNDGIQGLYVPASDFREMMQLAGSRMAQSSNVSITSNQSAYQQLMSQMGQDFYRSVTSAVSSRIRQNKAKLKYSSIIYLVNEDDKTNDNF